MRAALPETIARCRIHLYERPDLDGYVIHADRILRGSPGRKGWKNVGGCVNVHYFTQLEVESFYLSVEAYVRMTAQRVVDGLKLYRQEELRCRKRPRSSRPAR